VKSETPGQAGAKSSRKAGEPAILGEETKTKDSRGSNPSAKACQWRIRTPECAREDGDEGERVSTREGTRRRYEPTKISTVMVVVIY